MIVRPAWSSEPAPEADAEPGSSACTNQINN